MKKRAPIVLLSLCIAFSMLFVGCNKSENTNETNRENETTQENETNQQNETETQATLEPKTTTEFLEMLVKEGMLKKASDLRHQKSDNEPSFYDGSITAPQMAFVKNANTMSVTIQYDPTTEKVLTFSIFGHKRTGETTPYNNDVKESAKVVLKFMNNTMTKQQLEEIVNELDPKGVDDEPIYVDDKYGLYYYNIQYKSGLGHLYISYRAFSKTS